MNQTLLIELLTEELPPKALCKLGERFGEELYERLQKLDFLNTNSSLKWFATPRRLAAQITQVRACSPSRTENIKLMPISIGRDVQGKATIALQKKLESLGAADIPLNMLEIQGEGKSQAFYLNRVVAGSLLKESLQSVLEASIKVLPIPKLMTYQLSDGSDVQFVRPAHGLVCLFGQDVLSISALGLLAGRQTLGHRFLCPSSVKISHAESYAQILKDEANVLADYLERREIIRFALQEKAVGSRVLMPDALLEEVTGLVEWPVVYECKIDEEFLKIPQECLILTMQTNQKYFATTDASNHLRAQFLIVSNIATNSPENIILGNERVVRPRLADAKFFFEQDQNRTLESRIPELSRVVYHNKLGTQAQRTMRVVFFAGKIATMLGVDVGLAERAALLAKCDLLTEMVGEFPELQGKMGEYYARLNGEPEAVSVAIYEQYQPRYSGDSLPRTPIGTVVALADKLETLVGIWGIGLAPTGEKDPFALRRHALGILRMLLEKSLALSLSELLLMAEQHFGQGMYPDFGLQLIELRSFIDDRLRGLLKDRGFQVGEIESVLAKSPERLDDLIDKLEAIRAFVSLPEAPALIAANKRITNSLKKSGATTSILDETLLQEDAERILYDELRAVQSTSQSALAAGDFKLALCKLADLRAVVDTFFAEVMVNAENPALRTNRLALLTILHGTMNEIADISRLA